MDKSRGREAEGAKRGVVGKVHRKFTENSGEARAIDNNFESGFGGQDVVQGGVATQRKADERIGETFIDFHGEQHMRGFQGAG